MGYIIMKTEIINANEAGQRLDKYLKKYLSLAPGSFIYKMLRKKNITLNNKKADGTEKLNLGDSITFFLSDETYEKFHGVLTANKNQAAHYVAAYFQLKNRFTILYEDGDILLLNKSAGVLSQKAKESDTSINEAMIGYLLHTQALQERDLNTFKPSVCNRLDRNTSGIVICGKSLSGLQTMSQLLKERTLHKYYHCIVDGVMTEGSHLEGYISKDETINRVTVYKEKVENSVPIITDYRPLGNNGKVTLLEVALVTGKTHQIRAHLASVGHPILGDHKYGHPKTNAYYKEHFLISHQLLHAHHIEFPVLTDACSQLSRKTFTADTPVFYEKIMNA